MADKSLADKLRQWQALVNGTKARSGEFPFLAGQLERLATLQKQVEELVLEQNHAEARLREATRRRIEAETEGEELAGRIVGALKALYGRYNPALEEFGIRPNTPPGPKGRRRREEPAADETAR